MVMVMGAGYYSGSAGFGGEQRYYYFVSSPPPLPLPSPRDDRGRRRRRGEVDQEGIPTTTNHQKKCEVNFLLELGRLVVVRGM